MRIALAAASACCAIAATGSEALLAADRAPSVSALALSPRVVVDLERFRGIGLPGYFAISRDGRASGYALCRDREPCGDATRQIARQFCERSSSGVPCVIYASDTEVLWSGSVAMPEPGDVDLVRRDWHVVPAIIAWSGRFADSRSWVLLPRKGQTYGWFKVTRSREHGPCYGVYAAHSETRGEWSLLCGPDAAASGEWERRKEGWVSRGRDRSGNLVQLTIGYE